MTLLIPTPGHAPHCAQCGKTQTGGWLLRTVVTAAGRQLVCGVGPCGQLARIRATSPQTIDPEDETLMPFQPPPPDSTISAYRRGD